MLYHKEKTVKTIPAKRGIKAAHIVLINVLNDNGGTCEKNFAGISIQRYTQSKQSPQTPLSCGIISDMSTQIMPKMRKIDAKGLIHQDANTPMGQSILNVQETIGAVISCAPTDALKPENNFSGIFFVYN